MSSILPTFNVGPPPPPNDPRFFEWITQFWKWAMVFGSNTAMYLPITEGAGIILDVTTASGATISTEVTAADFAQYLENQKQTNELLFLIYHSLDDIKQQSLQEH